MQRFPLRTIILMILALLAFGWFYWNTHRTPRRAQVPEGVQEIQVVPTGGDR